MSDIARTPQALRTLLHGMATVDADIMYTGLCLDSRDVWPGDVFVALPAAECHIEQAVAQGAVAVLIDANSALPAREGVPCIRVPQLAQQLAQLAQRGYHHPSAHLTVIGITGTNGKTSCSHFIAQALASRQRACGLIGTLGYGVWPTLGAPSLTTPDIFTLHEQLASFSQQQVMTVCIEASSHGLAQGRLAGVAFDIAVLTNITRDHLDYHGDMQSYAAAKKQLFDWPRLRAAVINADDAYGWQWLTEHVHNYPVIAYTQEQNDGPFPAAVGVVSATQVQLDAQGLRARVTTPWGDAWLHSRLVGRFNLSNLLASLACLCQLGIPLQAAITSLADVMGVVGRLQTFVGDDKHPLVVVDFAHTPDALQQVLLALREHCQGRLFCVFGCGGDRDRGKRPLMARVAQDHADVVIVTDDNPRHESPVQIAAEIVAGFTRLRDVPIIHDRAQAIRVAIRQAQSGDVVLIAGKGHEAYQQIGEQRVPFSDGEQVRCCLMRDK